MAMSVIKLGGSLLDLHDLPSRLQGFLGQLRPQRPVLILVGGGAIVDIIRESDLRWGLDEAGCHWLCVQLMNSTAKLLHLLFPDWPLILQPSCLEEWTLEVRSSQCDQSPGLPVAGSTDYAADHRDTRIKSNWFPAIVAPSAFYSPTLNARALPQSWDTTSDSIGGLLARLAGADELILLKSVNGPVGSDFLGGQPELENVLENAPNWLDLAPTLSAQWSHIIDKSLLGSLSTNIRLRIVNLREWIEPGAL